jgi:hypothetical protein
MTFSAERPLKRMRGTHDWMAPMSASQSAVRAVSVRYHIPSQTLMNSNASCRVGPSTARARGARRSRRRGCPLRHVALAVSVAMIAATACRDAQTELSTAPAPHGAARSLSANSGTMAESGWNTYSAVVTLARADSSLFGNLGSRDVRFHVTRTRRTDGTWATSVSPVSDTATITGAPRESTLGFARIEITNSEMKAFNARGEQLARPIPDFRKGTDFEERARRARASHPGQFPDLPAVPSASGGTSGSPQSGGGAGLDMLIAGPEAGMRARFRLARMFSLPPERRGPTLRYSQTQGDVGWG